MRVAAGIAEIAHGFTGVRLEAPIGSVATDVLAIVAGLLLLAGLWTPIAGSLIAALGIWCAISQPGDPLANLLLSTIGAALVLVGPGAWSVDAQLFGWKRIEIRDRNS